VSILPRHAATWTIVSVVCEPPLRPDDLGLGALFRLTHDAVIVVDLATNRVALVNRAAERLLGYTSQQAARLPIERLVPLSERPGVHALVHGLLHRPSPVGVECRILGACGQERWVELTAHAIESTASFALLVCHDITERKVAEARRQEQARVEGMLRTIETLGQALDRELALTRTDLLGVVADRHVSGSVRILAERSRQGVTRALGLLDQLRRVGQAEDIELARGADDIFAPVAPAPATNCDDEGVKQPQQPPQT
jgi:PAS domain S-box-containing protein